MPVQLLFSAAEQLYPVWRDPLARQLEECGIDAEISDRTDHPETIDYIVCSPNGPISDFRPFSSLKAVLSLWAGVEQLLDNPTIHRPIARMVDSGMTESMTAWVVGQTLRHHLGLDRVIANQDGTWHRELLPVLPRATTVAVLGLGQLGRASAAMLSSLNFRVIGWSQRSKDLRGMECRTGRAGLESTVAEAEIIVLLLPHTKTTTNLVDATLLTKFKPGAVIINSGRGALIDEDALLDALASGRIAHATLDVFQAEPLPREHPFWMHPRVTVSPHIAADTPVETAVAVIAENIRRGENGMDFLYLADKDRGY